MDGEMKDMVPEPSRAERPEGIARPQEPQEWRCPKCGAEVDERWACCEGLENG